MDQIENKIKNFFKKKKTEAKFKAAGPGRKLAASSTQSQSSPSSSKKPKDVYVPVKRGDLSNEAKMARDAALERATKSTVDKPLNFSLKAIKEQAKKELEDERKSKSAAVDTSLKNLSVSEEEAKKDYTVDGVFFGCSLISEEILPKKEWKGKIKEFLYEQMTDDAGLTACLIIKNCNTLDRAEDCIETIKKYLNNIIANPSEEKFQKIRMSNRIYSEKVANVEGSFQFMEAAGFREQVMEDGEAYLVWSPDFPTEILIQLHEALDLCEVIQLELDRNVKVLLPSQIQNVSLPPDFFRITMEELKREQQARTTAMEESLVLKTKAMRDKEQERYANRFKYSLIRIRFPDGMYLQGTFGVHEKLANVFEFVAASLHHESAEFSLVFSPEDGKFSNEDSEKTLHNLRLVPNVILKFAYEGASCGLQEFLKEDLLMLVQQI